MREAQGEGAVADRTLRPRQDDPVRLEAYIAGPTAQSHAAMLHRLPDGDLGLAWFGGTQEGVGDISIWFARLAPGTERWTDPVQLSADAERSEQNPVLFTAPGGQLWLLFTAQVGGNQDTAQVRRRVSTDSGRTWSKVETFIPADERSGVFVRQPIVVTTAGRWVLPVFRCVRTPGERWSGRDDTSSVFLSDDEGSSWREVEVPGSVGCVHMNVLEVGDRLVAFFRSRRADAIYRSESTDGGDSWTVPTPTELPNNNSSIQSVVLDDGSLAMVFNDSSRADATARRVSLYDEVDDEGQLAEPAEATVAGEDVGAAFWGAPRAPMTLARSTDAGRSWTRAGNLDEGDGYCLTNNSRDGLNRELSYPVITQDSDGALDIAYTYHRRAIKHVRVPAAWGRPSDE